MGLFQKSVLRKYLASQDAEACKAAYDLYVARFHDPHLQAQIGIMNEVEYQDGFLTHLFVNILGYTKRPEEGYNLVREKKNETDGKKADGAILRPDGSVIAVIELKGAKIKDLDKIDDQAWGYQRSHINCSYVITSNFEKLRFFIDNAVEHEEFNLFTLTQERFSLLWLCLQKDNLQADLPKKVKIESLLEEERVTERLYKDYSAFKADLWSDMCQQNSELDELELYKKSQKLLARFLFIFFAEDKGLLPPNSISLIVSQWKKLKEELDEYKPLYSRFQKYFGYMNDGFKGKNYEIHAYNGGLFKADPLLDDLSISDDVLKKHVLKLTEYDFDTEVDTNILGHIFEHSLNEIENVRAQLAGEEVDESKTKRKKEGVFYTPKFVTKYMVDQTIGKLCEDKKQELEITDEVYGGAQKRSRKRLANLEAYRQWLLQLKICDPACGSGAFLNQALELLIDEHRFLDELTASYHKSSLLLSDVDNQILENNLYGVDINEESVEIARLSLWLRTAKKGRTLTSLSENIKCGNSLIDDPEVAGELAFNWKEQFPDVFENGGFDVVIGNPPYGILIDESTKSFYEKNFPLTTGKANLYVLFLERTLQVFDRGVFHFIIPKSLLFNTYFEPIRRALISKTEINEMFTITEEVFKDADVGSCLLLKYSITGKTNDKNVTRLAEAEKIQNFLSQSGLTENNLSQDYFLSVPNCEISIVSSDSHSVLQKLNKLKSIKDFYVLKNGLNPGNIKHILIGNEKKSSYHKPIVWGKEISKYRTNWGGDYVNYDVTIGERVSLDDLQSKKGMNKQNRVDFALRTPEIFEIEKILIRKTGDSLIGSLDQNFYYFDTLVHGIYRKREGYELEPLLAIINSRVATKLYRLLHDIKGKVFAKISLDNLGSFPVPNLNSESGKKLASLSKDRIRLTGEAETTKEQFLQLLQSKCDLPKPSKRLQNWPDLDFKGFLAELKKKKIKLSLEEEAEWLTYFNKKKTEANTLQAEIDGIDKQIDQIVYELYGLSEEEINVVEAS